jgi:WD40 repeat protein
MRTHAAEGFPALLRYAMTGAERYDGPVTAVAEALHDLSWPLAAQRLNPADLPHGLAHALATGSWGSAPCGGHTLAACWQWLWPTFPPEERAELSAKFPRCEPPALPDLASLQLVRPLDRVWLAPHDAIWGCDVSPDGSCMVSASRGGYVIVWDMASSTRIAVGRDGDEEVRDCAVTPEGRRVISVNIKGEVTIWDLPTMAVHGKVEAPSGAPAAVYPSLYEPEQRAARRLKGSGSRWRRFAISPDGSRLAVAGWEAIGIWELESLKVVTTLPVDPDLPQGILALSFASRDRLVTFGRCAPIPVVTWDLSTGQAIARRTLEIPPVPDIQRALVTHDQQAFLAAGRSATIAWRLDHPFPVAIVSEEVSGQALAVSRDGALAVTSGRPPEGAGVQPTGFSSEKLRLWSLPELRQLQSWKLSDLGCRDIACAVAFTPDNNYLIVAGWEGVVRRIVLSRA